jgi:hypothetical protein
MVAILAGATLLAEAQRGSSAEVSELLSRVGERVERYFARAQSIVCQETVRLQPLGLDLAYDGSHMRQLIYELRVAWDASTPGDKPSEAKVLRQLISVDGRAPKAGDEPGCMDPKPVSPEPLAMLLAGRRSDYTFKWAGTRRDGRTVMLDFKSVRREKPEVSWKGECVSVDLPGRWRGRVWIESASADVLRLDEQMIGIFEIPVPKDQLRRGVTSPMIIDRADSSISYRPVTFHDPEETVMLPESIVTTQVVRNSGVPRLRMSQTFSDYRRFITGGRIVQNPDQSER